jgi:hypothetical protein
MYSDPSGDPRYQTLRPTSEEAEAWAAREHKRREAWLAGPTEDEQREWARRYRRRAAFGLAESSLGPSEEEISDWKEREHKRREGWLKGPTDGEKRDWARRYQRHGRSEVSESDLPPTDEEVDQWAAAETRRRQAWLAGPTDEEKRRWARREAGEFWAGMPSPAAIGGDLAAFADELMREGDLAAKGAFSVLSRAPMALWSYFVRAGRTVEDDIYQPPRRRRVRF